MTSLRFSLGFLVALTVTPALWAQQTPYTVFYRSNWQQVNPAAFDRSFYIRNHNTVALNGGSRVQWIGVEGAPIFYYASAEFCPEPENSQHPANKFGVTAFGDRTDAIGTYGFYANYARYIPMPYTDGHFLHIGLSTGALFNNVNVNKLRPLDGGDPIINTQGTRSYLDFAVGLMYRIRRVFYIGASMPQTFSFAFGEGSSKDRARHFYLMAGGFINGNQPSPNDRTRPLWMIEPSIWVRAAQNARFQTLAENFPLSIDANVRVHYDRKLWFGGGYGTNRMANVEIGFLVATGGDARSSGGNFQLGVAYGYPLGKKYLSFGSSVELTTSYYFQ